MWRALHHTPKFANTPYSRVAALDQLSRMVVRDLNLAKKRKKLGQHGELGEHGVSPSAGSSKKKKGLKGFKASKGHEAFIDRVKGRIGKGGQRTEQIALEREEASLKGMIRVDEWGSLMYAPSFYAKQALKLGTDPLSPLSPTGSANNTS
jgi:hypothetical protein